MPLAMIVLAAVTQAASPPPAAVAEDPAVTRIDAFYAVLLDTMKHGKTLGFEGRVAKLRPVVTELFNVSVMAQFAVGPRWAAMTGPQQQSITDALTRYTIRSYAHNFDSYSNEKLHVDPRPAVHGADKLVKTTIASSEPTPTSLGYRMREYGGAWKVIDVYYNAVSQVTVQRSDFASTLAAGGAPALVEKLDSQTHALH